MDLRRLAGVDFDDASVGLEHAAVASSQAFCARSLTGGFFIEMAAMA